MDYVFSLGNIITLNSERYGNEVALVWRDQRLSYRLLEQRTRALANAILDMGLKKGDRAVLLSANCCRFVEVHIACSKAGIILVPMNTMLKTNEVANLMAHCKARMLFTDENYIQTGPVLAKEVPTLKNIVQIRGDVTLYEELIQANLNKPLFADIGEDDIAYITYTSGTTGLPKGVTLTNRNLFYNAVNASIGYNLPFGGVEVIPFPLFFSAVFTGHVISHFFVGGRVVILDWFQPDIFIETLNRERPTFTVVNPTMLQDFTGHPRFTSCDLSSLKLFLVTAAPISQSRFNEAQKKIGNILIQAYGLTESTAFVTCTRPQDYDVRDNVLRQKRISSVGRPGPTVELLLADDDGHELPTDGVAIGELLVKSPSVMKGYWEQPEATTLSLSGGWLHTGDLATIDDDGYVQIVGRKKDVIKSGGINVYPEEIEAVLQSMPQVKEAAVIGRPDERWGESVTAVVVLKPGVTLSESEVINHCRELLASYKKPTKVVFTDMLPRNPSGKVKKFDLRDKLAP